MKKTLSTLLSLVLVASMTATAMAASDPTISVGGEFKETEGTGESTIQPTVISYQVPTKLDFAIDAYQKADDTESQIYSPAFSIINMSDVAINAVVKASVQPKADQNITIVSSAKEVNTERTDVPDKQAYLEIVAASAATKTTIGGSNLDTVTFAKFDGKDADNKPTGANTIAKARIPEFVADATAPTKSSENAQMVFALEKATFKSDGKTIDALAGTDGNKGIAAFRFMGAVNPAAKWAAKDLVVKTLYDVSGLSTTMFTSVTNAAEADVKTAGQNLVSIGGAAASTPSVKASFVAGTSLTFTITKGNAASLKSVTCDQADLAGEGNLFGTYVTCSWDTDPTTVIATANADVVGIVGAGDSFTFTFVDADGNDIVLDPITLS